MIGSLRGTLLERGDGEILVEVAGVGYRVAVAPATTIAVGEVGDGVFVHVHHHIREDAQVLYGFTTADERRCFEILIGTHGIGPALALAILSVHDPVALARLVADEDVASLCLVPGVGRKTAQRLLVELASRLDVPVGSGAVPTGGRSGVDSVRGDVREALVGLGYGDEEIAAVLGDLPDEGDTSELLKVALKRLATA